jgi:hypothetical protein
VYAARGGVTSGSKLAETRVKFVSVASSTGAAIIDFRGDNLWCAREAVKVPPVQLDGSAPKTVPTALP